MTSKERRAWHQELGRNIRAARSALGLRQREVGLPFRARVSRIERGHVEIDVREFCQMRAAMAAAIERGQVKLDGRRREALDIEIPPEPAALCVAA